MLSDKQATYIISAHPDWPQAKSVQEQPPIKACILLPGEQDYHDFVHPKRSSAYYHWSLEKLLHRDIQDVHPGAVEMDEEQAVQHEESER